MKSRHQKGNAAKTKVTISEGREGKKVLQIGKDRYEVDAWRELGPAQSMRYRADKGEYVVDRNRDFGGTGKDAVKLELNVPLSLWLGEIGATKLEDQPAG